jgi:uncharacterized protein (DUF2236 family)
MFLVEGFTERCANTLIKCWGKNLLSFVDRYFNEQDDVQNTLQALDLQCPTNRDHFRQFFDTSSLKVILIHNGHLLLLYIILRWNEFTSWSRKRALSIKLLPACSLLLEMHAKSSWHARQARISQSTMSKLHFCSNISL